MRLGWVIATAMIVSVIACQQTTSPTAQCADASLAPEARVAACTTAIEQGELGGSSRAAALANRGEAHVAAQQVTPALRDFEAALTLDARNPAALRGRALILLDSGQLDAAEPLVDRLISLQQDLAEAHLMKGRIAFRRGDYAAAVMSFDRALSKDSRLSQALALRGRAKEELGDVAEARADYDAAIAIAPPRADALAWRCWLQLRHVNDDRAASQSVVLAARVDAEAAVHADPHFVEGQTCLGVLRLRNDEWSDARDAFEAALQTEPGNPVALFGRGVARHRSGDGGGVADMQQAISFSPHVRELYRSLGVDTY